MERKKGPKGKGEIRREQEGNSGKINKTVLSLTFGISSPFCMCVVGVGGQKGLFGGDKRTKKREEGKGRG